MLVNGNKVVSLIENYAPLALSESWDNCGFNVGGGSKVLHKIMLALEVTQDVVDEAIEKSIDLIITHHPLIFKEIKKINEDTALGKLIMKLIKNNISVYCAHTNLDVADGGLSDHILNLLEAESISSLTISNFGRLGILKEKVEMNEFMDQVKQLMGIQTLRVSSGYHKKGFVKKIGICTGAGADFIEESYKAGCDVYMTGDIKYHEYRLAEELGVLVFDIGHFESENIYMTYLYEFLTNEIEMKDYEVKVIMAESLKSPFVCI